MSTVSVVIVESHHLVRSREFSSREVEDAITLLHSEHATGKLIVNLSGGKVGSIQFEERAKLPPTQK